MTGHLRNNRDNREKQEATLQMIQSDSIQKDNSKPGISRRIEHRNRRTCKYSLSFYGLIITTATPLLNPHSCKAQEEFCDFLNDLTCNYKFDKECDVAFPQCANGDCFDCDPGQAFNFDCAGCVEAGYYWCPGDAVCQSESRGSQFWSFGPGLQPACPASSDWKTTCDADPDNVFTDPLYDAMKWQFEMINIEEVWQQGITGAGIHVRVNDDGVDSTHPEFAATFDVDGSCTSYLPVSNEDAHGTACASIIGGNKNNNECSVGLAPDVTISACITPVSVSAAAEMMVENLDVVDVMSNSWGPLPCEDIAGQRQLQEIPCPFLSDHPETPCRENACGATLDQLLSEDCKKAIISFCRMYYELDVDACGEYLDLYVSCEFHSLSALNNAAFSRIVTRGRGGKGVVITFAGGNDYHLGVDANGDGMVNSRYTIGVGAVGKDGLHASYSTTGAAIFVAAPGGDDEAITNNVVAKPGGGCHDITVGTSFATPVISAVAALMLQANPELGWRDVQGILAVSSQKVDFEDYSWTTNAAGVSHSYKYGFGLVDAAAAVGTARTWQNWESEKQILVESGPIDLAIPDKSEGSTGVLVELSIAESDVLSATGEADIVMESVVVYLDLNHGSRGDLRITLTSPQGTEAILAPGKRPENTILYGEEQRWKLMSLRSWGESPVGIFTLEIEDDTAGVIGDCVNFPWEFSSQDDYFTCGTFDKAPSFDCQSLPDFVLETSFHDLTPLEACCVCGGGQLAADIPQELQSWNIIVYGHRKVATQPPTLAPTVSASVPAGGDLQAPQVPVVPAVPAPPTNLPPVDSATCNYRGVDTCLFESLFDNECSEDCLDCYDCDPCQEYSATSCATCVENGCVWCSGDATCLSVALDAQYWATFNSRKSSSCPVSNDWVNSCTGTSGNFFPDPLYDSMKWSYDLINIEPAWREGLTGAGVHVRVNDDGVDGAHPELASNFDLQNSCTDYLPDDAAVNTHGTACASIIAGSSNDECAVGIAPNAAISACKFPANDNVREAEMFLTNFQAVDISSNSYGPDTCVYTKGRERHLQQSACPFPPEHELTPCTVCGEVWGPGMPDDCLTAVANYCRLYYEDSPSACIDYMDFFVSCNYHILPTVMLDAWTRSITEGRNGLGVVYLVAAGNLYSSRENTNANGYLNSRFTMSIAAVGKDGRHASYSSTGSSVFIAAPGGDFESVSNNIVAKPGGGCHDISIGTSFATPVVSGVVALILEVNPFLGWRDIQGILASTAVQVDATDASWTTNSAGISHSSKYGFGLVDASAAVEAGRSWLRLGTELSLMGESGPVDIALPDSALQQFTSSMTISAENATNLILESVEVYMDLTHPSRGDFEITLTAPDGTTSELSPGNRPLNQQLEPDQRWKFLSYSFWGVSPLGEWTLTVVDRSPGTLGSCRDYEWAYEGESGIYLCSSFEGATDCSDPNQVADQFAVNGVFMDRTALQACCSCGGGQDLTAVENLFKSWRLQLYTHDPDEVVPTPPPTVARPPTQSPRNGTSFPLGGIPVPTRSPIPLAPVPLTEAIVMTIPPNVTDLPFITSASTFRLGVAFGCWSALLCLLV